MLPAPYNALDEMQCWVSWRLSYGTARSQLGTLRMPVGKAHYGRESRTVWYLDLQHRLARLLPRDRRILVLLALGHTQRCIARDIGSCLRHTVRFYDEALTALALLDKQDRVTRAKTEAHPSERDVQRWMDEPLCQCWSKRPGPGSSGWKPTLAAKWTLYDSGRGGTGSNPR